MAITKLEVYAGVRAGLLELFAGPELDYFTMDNDVEDIVDEIYAIMEACQLRSETLDGEIGVALSTVIAQKIERVRPLILASALKWSLKLPPPSSPSSG